MTRYLIPVSSLLRLATLAQQSPNAGDDEVLAILREAEIEPGYIEGASGTPVTDTTNSVGTTRSEMFDKANMPIKLSAEDDKPAKPE